MIFLLDFGENFGVSMISPFFIDTGISKEEIGWLLGTGGSLAGLCGAAATVLLLKRLSYYRSLLLFAVLQAIGLFGYVLVAKANAVSLLTCSLQVLTHLFCCC